MKLYIFVFIFILLTGCSNNYGVKSHTSRFYLSEYKRDLAGCDVIASDLERTIERDTIMGKIEYYFFKSRSHYIEKCLRKRGYLSVGGIEEEY